MIEENHKRSKSTTSDGQILYVHMMISVEVIVMVGEIGGGMVGEEVDEVHHNLIPGSKKVKTAKGIPKKGELPPACIN